MNGSHSLPWFPMEVHFDERVEALLDKFGNDGLSVLITLRQSAFRNGTGRLSLSSSLVSDSLARRSRVSPGTLEDILGALLDLGIYRLGDWEDRRELVSDEIENFFRQAEERREHWREKKRKQRSKDPQLIESIDCQTSESPEISSMSQDVPGDTRGRAGESIILSPIILSPIKEGEVQEGEKSEPPLKRPPKRPPGWREGTDEVRPGVFMRPDELAKLRALPGGEAEAGYWLEQLETAAENSGKSWTSKKNHYRTALSWRDMRLEEGKTWDPTSRIYRRYTNGKHGPVRQNLAGWKTPDQLELEARELEQLELEQERSKAATL